MKVWDVVDDDTRIELYDYLDQVEKEMSEHIYELKDKFKYYRKAERKRIAAKIDKKEYLALDKTGEINIGHSANVFLKSILILELLGYKNTAEDLSWVYKRACIASKGGGKVIRLISDGVIKRRRSEAASGPRHHLHDEIVAIMKATWKKEPALSKTKMIAKLSRRYEGRISEETIKCWIKSEKLAPPPPPDKKYKNTELVIPPEYA
ncbi:hypothetical protein ACSYOV_004158 [Escherichia coli]|uniref:hypothetical protein n=1 Tax=Escherichia coli TaxID=562 RepID=UPI00069897D6|nr:hypothetical protein [Escherichia coli]EEX9038048.1 hypothetical protein [Escherichia coli]EFI6119667.1 hypothetical protein [Escherichia coli]EFU2035674.1 hypothetical protein [Escherichia coli]EKT4208605.1 hypothetical protein [Escherichia coli]ELV9250560.1 hypothetical protein [Escherichia coli]